MQKPWEAEESEHAAPAVTPRAESREGEQARRRLDEVGWGVFLMMIGAIALVPSVPDGTWLTGTGLLLLLLNAARYRRFGDWSGVSTLLGVVALVAGLGQLSGVDVPLFAICAVVLGASLVLAPLLKRGRPHGEPLGRSGGERGAA